MGLWSYTEETRRGTWYEVPSGYKPVRETRGGSPLGIQRISATLTVANPLIDGPSTYDHYSRKLVTGGHTMQVSIRELKAHLSQYLSRAQAGQSLEITSHRKVVARIIGVPTKSDQGLVRLLAGGAATWAGGKPAGASLRLSAKGTPVSRMVMEDRG